MQRKTFLKNLGLLGIAGLAPAPLLANDEPSNDELLKSTSCTNTPSETAGPYPLPSSTSTSSLVRTDITEGSQTGIPLSLTLTILNSDNGCNHVSSGYRVDIWHCNKRGYYSAYDGQPGIDGTVNNAGSTWLRGIQYTDTSGKVTFTTIYPGWYSPRATHIHVEIFSGTTLLATTQVCFPEDINTTVNTYYATSGTNSVTNLTDMVFSDSYANEMLTVTGNTSTGYTASANITISAGTTGINELSAETGGQFDQFAIYPNPINGVGNVQFYLVKRSDVVIEIYDVNGRKINALLNGSFGAGLHTAPIQISTHVPTGSYLARIKVSNDTGTFIQNKKLEVL